MRSQSRALVLEHLAGVCADQFRGNDARGPKKLLLMPNGTRCRAEADDVFELETELRTMAAASRREMNRLLGCQVVVDDVVSEKDGALPNVPPNESEGVVDAAATPSPVPDRPQRRSSL